MCMNLNIYNSSSFLKLLNEVKSIPPLTALVNVKDLYYLKYK